MTAKDLSSGNISTIPKGPGPNLEEKEKRKEALKGYQIAGQQQIKTKLKKVLLVDDSEIDTFISKTIIQSMKITDDIATTCDG
jgi:adenylosuccinate synthase